jgi:hypothetical protein
MNQLQTATSLVKSTTQLIKDIIKIPLGAEKKKPKVPIKETSVVQAPEDYKPFEKSDDNDEDDWQKEAFDRLEEKEPGTAAGYKLHERGNEKGKRQYFKKGEEMNEWMDKGLRPKITEVPAKPGTTSTTTPVKQQLSQQSARTPVQKAICELNKSMELISGINDMIEKAFSRPGRATVATRDYWAGKKITQQEDNDRKERKINSDKNRPSEKDKPKRWLVDGS